MLELIKRALWYLATVLGGLTFLDLIKSVYDSQETFFESHSVSMVKIFWKFLSHSISGSFEGLINMGLFLGSIGFVLWLRHSLNNYYQVLREEGPPLISDFSLFVQDLPVNTSLIDLKLDLEAFFRSLNHNNGLSYSLVECSFCLYCEDFLNLERQIRRLKNTIFNLEENLVLTSGNQSKLSILQWNSKTKELSLVTQHLKKLKQEFHEILVKGKASARFTGKAFLTFESKHSVDDLLDRYSNGSKITRFFRRAKHEFFGLFFKSELEPISSKESLIKRKQDFFLSNKRLYRLSRTRPQSELEFNKRYLRVLPSVHPSNVNWNYFGVSRAKKLLIRFAMTSLAWVILFAGFLIVLRFYFYRKKLQKNLEENSLSQILLMKTLSLMVSLVVCLINQVIVFFTRLTSRFEYHKKKTQQMVQELRKMLFRMFFNASVCTFLISFDVQIPGKELSTFDLQFFNPVSIFVLIYNIFNIDFHFLLTQTITLFLVSCILFPLLIVFDPYYLIKIYTISQVKKERKIDIDQKSLNSIFELPQFDIISNSTSVIYLLFTASLYTPFFPILSLLALILFFNSQTFFLKKYFVKRYFL